MRVIMLSDSDSSINWNTYCENIIQLAEEDISQSDDTFTELGVTPNQCNFIERDKDNIIDDEDESDFDRRHPQVGD